MRNFATLRLRQDPKSARSISLTVTVVASMEIAPPAGPRHAASECPEPVKSRNWSRPQWMKRNTPEVRQVGESAC